MLLSHTVLPEVGFRIRFFAGSLQTKTEHVEKAWKVIHQCAERAIAKQTATWGPARRLNALYSWSVFYAFPYAIPGKRRNLVATRTLLHIRIEQDSIQVCMFTPNGLCNGVC